MVGMMGVNNNNNSKHCKLLGVSCVSDPILSTFHALTHWILTTVLKGGYYYYPHSTAKETEAQDEWVTCLSSHSQWEVDTVSLAVSLQKLMYVGTQVVLVWRREIVFKMKKHICKKRLSHKSGGVPVLHEEHGLSQHLWSCRCDLAPELPFSQHVLFASTC